MIRLIAFATVALALVAGCSSSTAPGQNDIAVQDNSFNPSATTITAGETVTWTWSASNQHNVTWDTGTPAASATQASGTYQRTFAAAGTYGYHCSIHGDVGSGMHGTVTVQ